MTQNPIRTVLSTLSTCGVRFLLMGGQACIFYGAAEFSRDTDITLLAELPNLARLEAALAELSAERIALPPFELTYLIKGHAVHFRCRRPDVSGMRLDVMASMRGVDAFPALWQRRTTVNLPGGETVDMLSLPDLVRAKKTQRDKNWPMVRRLVEAHHAQHEAEAAPAQVEFWLREARTPSLLVDLARRYPKATARLGRVRALLQLAARGGAGGGVPQRERESDYYRPLIRELEEMWQVESQRKHEERNGTP